MLKGRCIQALKGSEAQPPGVGGRVWWMNPADELRYRDGQVADTMMAGTMMASVSRCAGDIQMASSAAKYLERIRNGMIK